MAITRAQQYRQLRRQGGIMGSNAGSMLVTPTRDGSRPGYYGPDEGHANDPGHGSNAPGGDRDNDGGDDDNRRQQRQTNLPSKRTNPNYTGDDANKGKIKGTTTDKGGTGRDDQGNKLKAQKDLEDRQKREKLLAQAKEIQKLRDLEAKKKEQLAAAKEKEEKKLSELGFDKTSKFGTPIAKPKKTKYNSTTPNIFEQYLRNNVLTKTTEAITNSDLAYNLNAKERENYLEELKEKDPARYAEVMQDLGTMGYATNIGPVDIKMGIGPKFKDLGEPQAKAILEGGRKVNIDPKDPTGKTYDLSTDYTDYSNRFNTNDNTGGGGDDYVPPIVVKKDDTDDDDDTVNPRDYTGLGARFMGSEFDFTGLADGGIARAGYMDGGMPEYQGGIMDLESGRQMYFLGKLVKKATRAVKKVAKSPFGKAALLYFGGGALGNLAGGSGLGGMFRGAMTPSKFLARSKLGGIFSKQGLSNIAFGAPKIIGPPNIARVGSSGILGSGGKFSIGKALGLGLGIPTAMELLGVGKEEDEALDLGPGIDIRAIRNSPYRYLAPRFTGSKYEFADGGRIGYAEGSKEPVAKETMPLLDMDNQEMDLRAEGGFVPIGRMERADDVPARLSKNEFVFTADAVRNAGEGDIDKGAEVMYNMMKNLESGGEVSEESQGLDGAREMFQTSQRLEEVL
jgi:hypothetical protein